MSQFSWQWRFYPPARIWKPSFVPTRQMSISALLNSVLFFLSSFSLNHKNVNGLAISIFRRYFTCDVVIQYTWRKIFCTFYILYFFFQLMIPHVFTMCDSKWLHSVSELSCLTRRKKMLYMFIITSAFVNLGITTPCAKISAHTSDTIWAFQGGSVRGQWQRRSFLRSNTIHTAPA